MADKEKDDALKIQMAKYEKAIEAIKNDTTKYDELKTQVNDQIQRKIDTLEKQIKDIKSAP